MIDVAYVLAASLLVTDAGGLHPIKAILQEGAEAITESCIAEPLFYHLWIPGDEWCACLLVLHSFRESHWDNAIVGDHGKSHGAFQIQGYGKFKTWRESVRIFRRLLSQASVCDTPLEMLGAGHCGPGNSRDISNSRTKFAARMALDMRITP